MRITQQNKVTRYIQNVVKHLSEALCKNYYWLLVVNYFLKTFRLRYLDSLLQLVQGRCKLHSPYSDWRIASMTQSIIYLFTITFQVYKMNFMFASFCVSIFISLFAIFCQ